MGDLAKQLAEAPRRRWDLASIRQELDADDLAALDAALADRGLTGRAIADVLATQGFVIDPDTVNSWRRRRG